MSCVCVLVFALQQFVKYIQPRFNYTLITKKVLSKCFWFRNFIIMHLNKVFPSSNATNTADVVMVSAIEYNNKNVYSI